MSYYDPDDLSNKVDVGSLPGTQWWLSSQKPGHGLAQLRHPSPSLLWQSDGVQPHLVTIRFPKRTAVTHVSLHLDFGRDDSYTPTRVAVRAGTSQHDLVEVRTREFERPVGWRHFALARTGNKGKRKERKEQMQVEEGEEDEGREEEEDEEDEEEELDYDDDGDDEGHHVEQYAAVAGKGSTIEEAGESWASRMRAHAVVGEDGRDTIMGEPHARNYGAGLSGRGERGQGQVQIGSQRARRLGRRAIHVHLLQVCILSNHLNGKDSHVRGLRVFGPRTDQGTSTSGGPAASAHGGARYDTILPALGTSRARPSARQVATAMYSPGAANVAAAATATTAAVDAAAVLGAVWGERPSSTRSYRSSPTPWPHQALSSASTSPALVGRSAARQRLPTSLSSSHHSLAARQREAAASTTMRGECERRSERDGEGRRTRAAAPTPAELDGEVDARPWRELLSRVDADVPRVR